MYSKDSFIYRLAGREREKSASYYTPECLTKCLVKYALKELLKDKTADQILELKICEPAMGSAAFLNEAINQLADAYVEKKERELGKQIPYDQRFSEIQKVKMFIADRNVYGIDLNPTAVELAEVSLWLNTICEGGYIPWFGTQIQNGNSLIGARKQVYPELMISDYGLKSSYVQKHEYWYENAPTQVSYNNERIDKKSVYHFLLGDPGMANYGDKVIKALDEQNVKLLKKKVADFCKPYNSSDVETLQNLSSTIDTLWTEQVNLRKRIVKSTSDQLDVWGHKDKTFKGHMSIKQKDEAYRKIYRSEHMANAGCYARLKFAMDYWCALWFWPIDKAELFPTRGEYLMEMDLILNGVQQSMVKANLEKAKGHWNKNRTAKQLDIFDFLDDNVGEEPGEEVPLGVVDIDQLCEQFERLALVRQIASDNHFFHWGLEFADVFHDRGGFDLIIGNPPWIKIEWKEEDVLADFNPLLAIKKVSPIEIDRFRKDALSNPNHLRVYFSEYVATSGEQEFLTSEQNYPLLKGQQTNLYKCFLPQAWSSQSPAGVSAFVHPDGVFDDPKGNRLRRVLYHRIQRHFGFTNELRLFEDVHHCTGFSLNVYGSYSTIRFDVLDNLFSPITIDDSYQSDGKGPVPAIKDLDGNWCIRGHKDRIVTITIDALLAFARLFDGNELPEEARLPVIHAKTVVPILEKLANQPRYVSSIGAKAFGTEMWHETNRQKDKTIIRDVHFSNGGIDTIVSGPHFWVGNPLAKTSRRKCVLNSDYDSIDLLVIGEAYRPRCNYRPGVPDHEYSKRVPTTPWGKPCSSDYRVMMRNMFGQTGERTLVTAIMPPNAGHVHAVYEIAFEDIRNVSLFAGLTASIPLDFYIKSSGKGSGGMGVVGQIPFPEDQYSERIALNALLLNCLTLDYQNLWARSWRDDFKMEQWSKRDSRLDNSSFSNLTKTWSQSTPLRSDFARRQALIEIDVLTAMSLGLTLNELIDIYSNQFPVLTQYEPNTWFDRTGRIIYSPNKSLTNIGVNRETWEQIRNMPNGTYSKNILDDTLPEGPVERTITYMAPFDRCDRIEDYRTAWEFFEKKYGGSQK